MTTTRVLRKLITFADESDDEAACNIVSVKGDATYCIQGPVCGGATDGSSKEAQGACPTEGDAAIGHCVQTSRSFATGCVAPVDTQCVISALGHWECVFPDDSNDSNDTDATSVASQVATLSSDKMVLSAATKDSNTLSDSDDLVRKPNAALNVVVGAACCILALVGLAFVKKRRNAKRSSGKMLSDSSLSIMTL